MASLKNILNFSDIQPKVKDHLTQVYGTLSLGCMTATVGCMYTPLYIVNNFIFLIIGIIATIGLIIKMHSLRGNRDHGTKFACFLGVTFIDGAFLKPLVSLAQSIDPVILVNALVYTAAIFVSFSLVSLISKRRSFLFLGGILSSVMIGVSFGLLASWLFGFSFISHFQYNLLMVIVFSFYVIYDTQLIIEKASLGDYDYTLHALELFVDLVRIFIHILRILIENSDKKRKD